MSADFEGWLRMGVGIIGAFAASFMAVRVSLAKIETWAQEHSAMHQRMSEEYDRRFDHIEGMVGNGTPGVFIRRSEAQLLVDERKNAVAALERRVVALEGRDGP